MNRAEAKAAGLKTYSDGKPCKHGHAPLRVTNTAVCVECKETYRRKWRAENKTQQATADRRWATDNPARAMVNGARQRSKMRGFYFDLTPEDIELPTHCPILGMELTYERTERSYVANRASLDRLKPELGYVKGNVAVISMRANRLKYDCASPTELRAIADYIERNA